MLFNSYVFLFVFLPTTLLTLYLASRSRISTLPTLVLITTSLASYWIFEQGLIALLLASITFNFLAGKSYHFFPQHNRTLLFFSIAANLLCLAYFKYLTLLLPLGHNQILNQWLPKAALPLGISFFTFQQISYLVDTHNKKVIHHNFFQYLTYVSYFPQLVAGPIVRANFFLSQLLSIHKKSFSWNMFHSGLGCFICGLFKKVVVAETLGRQLSPFIEAANSGASLSFFEWWTISLGYIIQVYFDFSGYSDMAIGLGLMMGIRLPINFYSPLKSTNIRIFWRKWHRTISKFIREYVFRPLIRNLRIHYPLKSYIAVFLAITSLGIWHGSTLNFLFFGILHSFYYIISILWAQHTQKSRHKKYLNIPTPISIILTQLAVASSTPFFLFSDLDIAFKGFTSLFLPQNSSSPESLLDLNHIWLTLITLMIWVTLAPNTYQLFVQKKKYSIGPVNFRWEPSTLSALILGLIAAIAITFTPLSNHYIYFDF